MIQSLYVMEMFLWIFFMVTICHAADINYMNTTIQEHFSNVRHHETNPTYKESARAFIYQEFQRFGLDTEISNFTTDNVNGSNIIGILKGKRFGTFKDRIVGIGAHYDTVNNTPGVDDNGSGVAAMLEVAKRAGTWKRYNTVIFVSFDLGEDNLKGSMYFAKEWLPQFLSSKYNVSLRTSMNLYGFYILDTIMDYNDSVGSQILPSGLTEDKMNLFFPEVYRTLKADNFQGNYIHSVYGTNKYDSLDVPLLKAWESLSAPKYKMAMFPLPDTNVEFLISYELRDIVRSDHASFWRNFLPALYLTDSGNYRGDMINCYHESCDNMDVMLTDENLMFLGKQADALYYSLHYLAETDCGIPPDIVNTKHNITVDSLTAVYRCTEDTVVFPSTSNTNLTCLTSGDWSQISFRCVNRSSISVTTCHAADISYMRTTIQDHFSNIRHHETNPKYKELARTFIYQEFRRFGLDTEFHNFTTTDNVAGSNIIGILKGKRFGTLEDRFSGICAHYDTVKNSPGVDDNGSGLAVMLEVAKRASTLERRNTVLFISFDLEEDELKGSKDFVAQWLPRILVTKNSTDPLMYANQTNFDGFYVLDTIMEYNNSAHSQGFPSGLTEQVMQTYFSQFYNDLMADNLQGDYINSIYRKGEDESLNKALSRAWQSLPDPAYQMENLQIPWSDWNTIVASGFGEFLRSDHSNFWKKSYPAMFLTDSGNYRGDMINCYHEPCDNLNVMLTDDNLKFLGKQADALYCSLQYLDGTDCGTPTKAVNSYATRGCSYILIFLMTILLLMLV